MKNEHEQEEKMQTFASGAVEFASRGIHNEAFSIDVSLI